MVTNNAMTAGQQMISDCRRKMVFPSAPGPPLNNKARKSTTEVLGITFCHRTLSLPSRLLRSWQTCCYDGDPECQTPENLLGAGFLIHPVASFHRVYALRLPAMPATHQQSRISASHTAGIILFQAIKRTASTDMFFHRYPLNW